MATTDNIQNRPSSGVELPRAEIERTFSRMLASLGDKIDPAVTRETPRRVARMYTELLGGYAIEPCDVVKNALFNVKHDEMVVVRNIDFYSLCEHHLMPFYGRVHIGYLPHEKIVGLSKIPRLVDAFARRLQIQERLTEEIAQALFELLEARGAGVVIRATHLCVAMRGVRQPNTEMVTSALRGSFKSDARTREEFTTHLRST